jgi:predicted ATP-grasp superfamily ATP-dependent carboligase
MKVTATDAGRPHVLLLAEDDDFAYRVLCAAVAGGARVSVLGRGDGLRLRRSRLVDRIREAETPFEVGMADQAISMIDQCSRDWGIDLVVPTNAGATRFLCAARDRLTVAPALAAPDVAVFDALNDKARFAVLLRDLGVPAPPTLCFDTVQALQRSLACGELEGPGVVKPAAACGGRGVRRLDPADPAQVLGRIDYQPIIWQPFIEGPTWSASAYCRDGRMHGFVIYIRQRGVYTFFQDEAVRAQAAKIVARTAFSGLINFDMISPAVGPPLWLECNPRVFYSLDAHAAIGLDYLAPGLAKDARALDAALASLDRRAQALTGRRLRKLRASVVALASGETLTPRDMGFAARQLADPVFMTKDRCQALWRKLTA